MDGLRMEHPSKMDDLGVPHIFGNLHIICIKIGTS